MAMVTGHHWSRPFLPPPLIVATVLVAHTACGLQARSAALPENREDAHVLFFAGVEGSGHGILQAVWKQSFPQSWENIVPLPPRWRCGDEWTAEGIKELEDRLDNFTDDTFPTDSSKDGGPHLLWSLPQHESYPECARGDHNQRMVKAHPRLEYLNEAVKGVKLKFHVTFLHRNLDDCLATACLTKKSEPCKLEVDTLLNNAKELAKQLKRIDHDTISCLRTSNLTTMETQINKTLPKPTAVKLLKELKTEAVPKYKRNKNRRWQQYVESLSKVNAELDNICKSVPQTDLMEFQRVVEQGAKSKRHNEEEMAKEARFSEFAYNDDETKSYVVSCCDTCKSCVCCPSLSFAAE